MSVVVAEEGNRRVGDMTTAEIHQCVLDIKSWFMRSKGGKGIVEEPASSSDVQRLEKVIDNSLPRAQKIILAESNGGLYFMERKLYSTTDIIECVRSLEKSSKWRSGLVPFCGDSDFNSFLVIDTNHDDEVVEYERDDGLGDVVCGSLLKYFEQYRNDLLSGHFEFLEDIGVIEKMASGAKSHK